MLNQRNIYLIGPMGAGKTSVGKHLAKIFNFSFFDSDHEIETRSGISICEIFNREQEQGFRQRETLVLENLTQLQGIILATGGGCVMIEKNRDLLKNKSFIIYLQVSLATQLLRIRQQNNRPLISAENTALELKNLNSLREPWYHELATCSYATENFSSAEEVAQQIFFDLCKS